MNRIMHTAWVSAGALGLLICTTAAATAPTPEDAAEVYLADTGLGQVLAGEDNKTLYVFKQDEGGKPTCNDDCAKVWPPLLTKGEPKAEEGVDKSKLGTVNRTDGSTQVTYDNQPLYYYAADTEPKQTNGQGTGGVWFVVGADGKPITSMPSGTMSPSMSPTMSPSMSPSMETPSMGTPKPSY